MLPSGIHIYTHSVNRGEINWINYIREIESLSSTLLYYIQMNYRFLQRQHIITPPISSGPLFQRKI